MWQIRGLTIGMALYLRAIVVSDHGFTNPDAEPYVIAMVNSASVGPDGTMYPSSEVDHCWLTRMCA